MAQGVTTQPWIYSAKVDGCFILAPAFVITMLVLCLQWWLPELNTVSPWMWLFLIVGIDVSHVYSTVFRTYLDRRELRQRRALYVLTPLLAWLIGCLLYSIDKMVFWRVLAYLAVFHFVRQQYGFMMIYARKEPAQYKTLDKLAIYIATLYPLIYWHCHQREFDWFIHGDFIQLDLAWLSTVAALVYGLILCAYLVKEWRLWRQYAIFNVPRNLMLFGTLLSWYVGIIWLNNDLAFSAINVVAHGIPYLALIWIYGRNQTQLQGEHSNYSFTWITKLFQPRWVWLYIVVLFVWGYLEESFWDAWVWQEHGAVLWFSQFLGQVSSHTTLVWLVPLLAMPQVTHYLLDAYIWRMQQANTPWKKTLFLNSP